MPQNRSRTSTQAMIVPTTTLTTVTSTEVRTVSLIAAHVCGLVSVAT